MSTEPAGSSPANADARKRVLLAAGAAAAFALVIGVVAIASSSDGEGSQAAPAPAECLEAWNEDEEALSYARHNSIFHNYDRAQVGYMRAEGATTISQDPAEGECVVVFARTQLDPEIAAAGQILRESGWTPLSELLDINELAALQSGAFDGANARPEIEGALEPL